MWADLVVVAQSVALDEPAAGGDVFVVALDGTEFRASAADTVGDPDGDPGTFADRAAAKYLYA